MLARFFSPKQKTLPQNRFNEKKESEVLNGFISQLTDKELELKNSSDKLGQATLDYAKYVVLKNLTQDINNLIDLYNTKPALADEQECLAYVALLQEIRDLIEKNKKENFDLLNAPRNSNLKNGQKILTCGALGAVGAAFTLGTFGTGVGVTALAACSGQALGGTYLFTGTTITAKIVMDFSEALKTTIKNFNFILKIQSDNVPTVIRSEDNMICPITQRLIEEPVICKLDGYSYEKEALVEWLSQHKKSFKTGKLMDPGSTIDSIICPNDTLKKNIDDFKQYQMKQKIFTPI